MLWTVFTCLIIKLICSLHWRSILYKFSLICSVVCIQRKRTKHSSSSSGTCLVFTIWFNSQNFKINASRDNYSNFGYYSVELRVLVEVQLITRLICWTFCWRLFNHLQMFSNVCVSSFQIFNVFELPPLFQEASIICFSLLP